MNHWKNDELFGENWFTFTKFYSEVAREIPEGSTIVEVGAWKGRSAAFLAEEFMKLNKKNLEDGTHLLFIAKNIERIGDHATNIAEHIYFLIKGTQIKGQRPKGQDSIVSGK